MEPDDGRAPRSDPGFSAPQQVQSQECEWECSQGLGKGFNLPPSEVWSLCIALGLISKALGMPCLIGMFLFVRPWVTPDSLTMWLGEGGWSVRLSVRPLEGRWGLRAVRGPSAMPMWQSPRGTSVHGAWARCPGGHCHPASLGKGALSLTSLGEDNWKVCSGTPLDSAPCTSSFDRSWWVPFCCNKL